MAAAGVALPEALRVATESLRNRVFIRSLARVNEEMLEGQGLAVPLSRTRLFPGTAARMIRVGEETGTLETQLEVTARYYESELDYKLKKLTAIFEPAIIIVVGLVVGFVAIAMVTAMYGIFDQVGLEMRAKRVHDRGETLVELLVAMTILGMTVVATIGGLTTSIMASDRHQKHAMAGVQVRAFAEAIQGYVVHNSGYLECATAGHYQIYTPPPGFTAVVTGIAYWNPAGPFTPAPLPTAGPSPAASHGGDLQRYLPDRWGATPVAQGHRQWFQRLRTDGHLRSATVSSGGPAVRLIRDERGMTMPELLIALVILSIIIGPLTAALIVYVRSSDTTVIRMGESHDVQIAASYFGQDISSLGMRDASLNFVQSVNNAAFPCTAAGTSVVLLAWDESTATGTTTVRVKYVDRVVAGERQLRRVQCRGNATPVSDIVVVHNLVGTTRAVRHAPGFPHAQVRAPIFRGK